MVGVGGRDHHDHGVRQGPAAVDVLDPCRLGRCGAVGDPHGGRGARLPAVHVAAEHGGARRVVPRENGAELGALGIVGPASPDRPGGAEVRGAHVERAGRRDTEPSTLLQARVGRERLVLRVPDACPGEHGESEQAACPDRHRFICSTVYPLSASPGGGVSDTADTGRRAASVATARARRDASKRTADPGREGGRRRAVRRARFTAWFVARAPTDWPPGRNGSPCKRVTKRKSG